jgi:hypothetical protein
MYERVQVVYLLHQHEEYRELKEAWEILHDFERGAPAVLKRREFYLPKKVGEQPDEYQNRLAKLAFTPHLPNAIRETTAKLAAAPLHVSNASTEYWTWVRKHLDGRSMGEDRFIKEIFSSMCYYGRVYTVVDRDPIAQMPMSKGEQYTLLSQQGLYPKVKILNPLTVTDWNLDQDWYVTTSIGEEYAPLQTPVLMATWKLYTKEVTYTYRAKVQLTDGIITAVWVDEPTLDGGGHWHSVHDPDLYLDGTAVYHGMGVNPMTVSLLKEELWVGGMTYSEQVQHIRVKSQLAEASYIAGTVVRVFTPQPPQERSPKALLQGNAPPKADHSHTLVGANYQFVESTGAAIDNLLKVLKDSEAFIQAVVSLDYKQESGKYQSADSKEVDNSLVEDVMKMLGGECKFIYQSVLDRFAILDGQEAVVVEGLENYGTDTLDQMLTQSQTIEALDTAGRMPMTALKLWYSRLCSLVAGDTFGEVEKQLQEELEELFSVDEEESQADPLGSAALGELMDTYGLTIEEAAYVMVGEDEKEVG